MTSDVIVLASFDLTAIPLTAWLAERHRVHAVLGRNALNARMPSDTRGVLAQLHDWAWVDDPFTSTETIEIIDRWARRCEFAAVVCVDEFGLIPAAQIRRRLGITTGQSVESAIAYRHKNVMHAHVRDHVRVPAQEVVDNAFDALAAADKLGFPVVLKPLDGAGGANTHVLDTPSALHTVLAKRGANFPSAILQEFVQGAMFHVDGFVDVRGELRHPTVSAYGGAPATYPDRGQWTSAMLYPSSAEWARLTALTQTVITHLPPSSGTPVHAEFFQSEDADDYTFCEIAARSGGSGIHIAYQHAVGPNPFELHARSHAGDLDDVERLLDSAHEFRPQGWYLRPPARGTLLSLPTACPLENVVAYDTFGRIGQNYDGPKSNVDAVQRFIVDLQHAECGTVFADIDRWCDQTSVWAKA